MAEYIITREPEDDSLEHWGIKGQRWGVRRFENEDGTLTKAGKERYGKREGYRTDVTKKMKQLRKGLKRETGSDMGDFAGQSYMNDIVIKKGSIAKRLSSKANEKESGPTYVTLNDMDHMHYVANVATFGSKAGLYEVEGTNPEGYSIKMKLTQDMVMPSYQHKMESFLRTVGKIGLDEVTKSVDSTVGKAWGSRNLGKVFLKNYKDLTIPEARDNAYRLFLESTMKNPAHREAFFKDMESRGYNAVVDNFDVDARKNGRHYFTSTIVFDRNKTLKTESAQKLDSGKMKFIKELLLRDGLEAVKDQKLVDDMYKTYSKTNDWTETHRTAVKAYKKEHPNTQLTDQQIMLDLFY